MEGGVAMMKPIRRKQGRYKVFLISLVLVVSGMFTSWGIGYAQAVRSERAKISRYEMDGRLQAFNLEEKWALIGGLKWSLADEFDTKEFAARLGLEKTGTVKFTAKQKSWATYYVILQTIAVSSVDILKETAKDKKEVKLILSHNEIKRIYEQGGKIYKIVPCGE
jgi:hypothetical protein